MPKGTHEFDKFIKPSSLGSFVRSGSAQLIESKGMFTAMDRRKHIAIKRQHPKLDIRFVFENSRRKLRKGAKSTYGEWCYKYGFLYTSRVIPEEWIKEKGKNKKIKNKKK